MLSKKEQEFVKLLSARLGEVSGISILEAGNRDLLGDVEEGYPAVEQLMRLGRIVGQVVSDEFSEELAIQIGLDAVDSFIVGLRQGVESFEAGETEVTGKGL